MNLQTTTVAWLVGAVLALGSPGFFAQAPKPDGAKDDQQTISSKAQKNTAAASIDFKKELELPFPTLGTLGSRIDTARRGHDPVALAHAASELAVAEKVSGKKASITSPALIKEAAELAKLRKEVAEMKAVENVALQVSTEADTLTTLKNEINYANQRTKLETDAIRANQEPTDAPRKILVNNYTTQYIDIWVNGYLKIQVPPGQSKWFVLEHKWNPTVLTGYGNGDMSTWGPQYVWGKFKTYTWNLN